jgi:RNA polymerase sigma factor (sigma-70 family)
MTNMADESDSGSDFEELIARVRTGDESAVSQLVHRYERAVLRTVRSRLGKSMRGALDSMDIMQSVHRSLLVGLRKEKFELSTPQQLIGLAVVMVQRKVARHWRVLQKMPRTQSQAEADSQTSPVDLIASQDPAPSRVVSAEDLLQSLLLKLDALDQNLVRLKLAGNTSVDTAKELQLDPAYVRMRWSRLRKFLQRSGYLDP